MGKNKKTFPIRALTGAVLCMVMFLCGLATLKNNLKPELDAAARAIAEKQALVLDEDLSVTTLARFMQDRNLVTSADEADYVARHIVQSRPKNGYNYIREITSTANKVEVDSVEAYGPERLKERAAQMKYAAGADESYTGAMDTLSSKVRAGDIDAELAPIKLTIKKNRDYPVDVSGVLVRLKEWHTGKKGEAESSIIAWARTDENGEAEFLVPVGGSFSVQPVRPGSVYDEKGTSRSGMLTKEGLKNLSFKAKAQKMSVLDDATMAKISRNKLLTVRGPEDFEYNCRRVGICYVLGWFGVFFVLYLRKKPYNYMLLIPLMVLTGLSMLVLLGLQDPLNSTPYANNMLMKFLIGLAALALISRWNYMLSFAKPIGAGRHFRDAFGIGCLVACALLVLWVGLAGWGPGGSNARVNLHAPGIGTFQPSELCKFLFVGFMAYFLNDVGNRLRMSAGDQAMAIKLRLRYTFIMLGIIALTMGIYIFWLEDMGPAMVLLIGFIIMYSLVRGDTKGMAGWTLAYGCLLLVARYAGGSRTDYLIALVVWLALWVFASPHIGRRDRSESALMLVVVLLAYTIGGPILMPVNEGLGERLSGRVEMCWGGVWDNYVAGGDQIVSGLWAIASGGHAGMGLGNTLPDMIPAGHTDMILASLGEITGLSGILLVCLSMLVLFMAGFRVSCGVIGYGRYLVQGIVIVTMVQFLLIGLGSMGLIPLTGVAVPLLSYGSVNLIATLGAFGFVLSTSGFEKEANMNTAETNKRTQGDMTILRGLSFAGVLLLFVATAREAIVVAQRDITRPAFVVNRHGRRMVVYNPRIEKVRKRLLAGNIYDRNGLLLATGSREDMEKHWERLITEGKLLSRDLEDAMMDREGRIYPFGPYTLFMTGNANYEALEYYDAANPRGYMAENRHKDLLRGLDFKPRTIELNSKKFRASAFLPKQELEGRGILFDYDSPMLVSMIKGGLKKSELIDEYNSRRDEHSISLTLDASLQKDLSDAIGTGLRQAISERRRRNVPVMRVSAVVLDARNGDLLASANWPLPVLDSVLTQDMSTPAPGEKNRGAIALTERDLGTTYFTFPGSTAKVMSGLAGMLGSSPEEAFRKKYYFKGSDITHRGEPTGNVDMYEAIWASSNLYFIYSVNEQGLYPQLDSIYGVVGTRLDIDSLGHHLGFPTYVFEPGEYTNPRKFHRGIKFMAEQAPAQFKRLQTSTDRTQRRKLINTNLGAPWGQGYLNATPLAMARVASIVANGGELARTRYLMSDSVSTHRIISTRAALLMDSAMHREVYRKNLSDPRKDWRIGGKTGTPERALRTGGHLPGDGDGNLNDAWYICYAAMQKDGRDEKLAIALRIERSYDTSTAAKNLMYNTVLPVLEAHGYSIKRVTDN